MLTWGSLNSSCGLRLVSWVSKEKESYFPFWNCVLLVDLVDLVDLCSPDQAVEVFFVLPDKPK